MIGRRIGNYQITSRIGEGGMGVVYRAEDTVLGRPVALKFLSQSLAGHAQARQRFINEARTASSLDHPNVCTIHEIGETDDGFTYIVMPFYDGEPLDTRALRGVSPAGAVELVRQAATGLARAHAQGIVHRDIKSNNLLVTRDGVVKVLDFGLAKLAGQTRMTRTGTTVGTAQYMSPEQARGEEVDERTDIYSLGVVLYELLTGRAPFRGDQDLAVLYAVVNEDAPLPSSVREGIPAALDAVVTRAMSKDRNARYATCQELIGDLDRTISGERVAAPPRKRPRRALLAALLAVPLIAAAVWFIASRDGSGPATENVSTDRRSLAVMYFKNLSGDPSLDWMQSGVVELLNSALARSSETTVLDTQRMVSIVREMGGNPDGGVDERVATDVARRAGVGTMIVGNIVKSGGTIRLQARMIDVANGEILHSDHVDGKIDDDIFAMVADLTNRIQTHLDISAVAETVDEKWIRDISTQSVAAYRDYVRGRRLFIQNEHARARPYFENAIAADSNFVVAWVDLVGACFNLEDFECVGRSYQHALRLRPRASPREQLYIDVTGAVIDGDAERQIALATELVALDPSAQFWRYIQGRGYYMSGREARALEIWKPLIDEGYNWVWTYAYGSTACVRLQRYDEGLRILERGLEITPPDNASARARLIYYRGRIHRETERYDDAIADFKQAVALDKELAFYYDYDTGCVYQKRGDVTLAMAALETYLQKDPDGAFAADATARLRELKGE